MDPDDSKFLAETMEVIGSQKQVMSSILDKNNKVYSRDKSLIVLL